MIAKQKPIWNSLSNDTRYFVITGGRGSGKSFEVGRFTSLLSFESGHKILYTRQTMTSAHLSVIPEFQEKIDLLEMNYVFDVNKTEIKNKQTNSEIIFRGIKTSSGDQTANLKSITGVTTWVLDEAEELTDESTFDKINLSIRIKNKQNRIILILNPATKEHWIYRKFFEEAGVTEGFNGVKGNTTYIHTTYLNNLDNLNIDFINEIELIKENNPKKYEHQILGGWLDKAEGVVFTNWKFGEFDTTLPYSFGADFGFSIDPSTLVKVAIDRKLKIIYVKELLYKPKLTTSELAIIYKQNVSGKELIIADSAEPRLIEEIQRYGFNIQATEKGAGSIKAGIELMRDYQLIIDKESVNVAKELNNYVYSDKASSLFVDNWNHAIDAIRYNVFFHLSNPHRGKFDIR
jgi:phage terminase large subunit